MGGMDVEVEEKGGITRKKRVLSDGPLLVLSPEMEEQVVEKISGEVKGLGSAKDERYKGYNKFVKDHENIMELSQVLHDALKHDIGKTPLLFHVLLVAVMSRNLHAEVKRRLVSGISILDFAQGLVPSSSHFTEKPAVDYEHDHSPDYLAQRMREAMGHAHHDIQLILNQRRQGQVVLEYTWYTSLTAKNGKMTRGAISVFNDFGMVMSASSMDKYLSYEALATWYRISQEQLVAKAHTPIPGNFHYFLGVFTFIIY